MTSERGSFSGKLGFVLTAAGAAIGLGCLWRFPNLVAQYGGGIFIITYVILLAALGVPLFIVEVAIGRKTQTGVLGAFGKLDRRFRFLGYLCLAISMLVQPYYSVLVGHIAKFSYLFVTGQGTTMVEPGFYNEYIATTVDPIIWITIFILISAVVVFFGVQKGLERLCKIILPIEAILLVGLTIYSLTLPGALEGFVYYLTPDFSKFNGEVILAAMGQVFYSLTLGFGIMLTLGSYLTKRVNLVSSAWTTGFFTLFIAFIAGSIIIPVSFISTSGNTALLGSGSIFEALPIIFQTLPLGMIVGSIFFILLTLAAMTANIASLEMMVTAIIDRFGISRLKSVIIMTVYTLVLAIPISLGYGVLDWISIYGMHLLEIFDFISGTILLPISALLICILVGYFTKPHIILDEIKLFSRFKHDKLLISMIKYVCPACIIIILLYGFIGVFI